MKYAQVKVNPSYELDLDALLTYIKSTEDNDQSIFKIEYLRNPFNKD